MFESVTDKWSRTDPAWKHARPIDRVVPAFATQDGAGVRLLRSLGSRSLRELDPFLMLDEIRSDDPGDWIAGFPPHPHRGFETVTTMLEGAMEHSDSAGNHGVIESGDLQWMTAGRGIVHSEMPLRRQGRLWGIQLWINLPATHKMMPPRYQEVAAATIPELRLPLGGRLRVLAGEAHGIRGPVQGIVTDPTMLDISLASASPIRLPLPADHTAFAYVLEGHARFGEDALRVPRSTLVSFGRGSWLEARSVGPAPLRFLVFAARPIGEPVARHGPFVMNTRAEIERAIADHRSGRLGT